MFIFGMIVMIIFLITKKDKFLYVFLTYMALEVLAAIWKLKGLHMLYGLTDSIAVIILLLYPILYYYHCKKRDDENEKLNVNS